MAAYPPRGMRGPQLIARWAIRRSVATARIEGLANVPHTGAVLLAARHYHHLLDGAVLVQYLPRPAHIVVGLDWARNRWERMVMEYACRAAEYPIVVRPESLDPNAARRPGREGSAYDPTEFRAITRTGLAVAERLLREERLLVVFPEGYPVVDPTFIQNADAAAASPPDSTHPSPTSDPARRAGRHSAFSDAMSPSSTEDGEHPPEALRPFHAGFARLVRRAEAAGTHVTVLPVGFSYREAGEGRWHIVARIGAPLTDRRRLVEEATIAVASLSAADTDVQATRTAQRTIMGEYPAPTRTSRVR